jgi:uncharacterized membrane protein
MSKKRGSFIDTLLRTNGLLHKKIDKHPIFKERLTLSQKAADNLSRYAGSWGFILGFLLFLALWVAANVYAWVNEWDPYPFILLNLILSCLAALQAPVILMSQNRQAQRDRIDAKYDHAVNRKAEREIQKIMKDLVEIRKGMKR